MTFRGSRVARFAQLSVAAITMLWLGYLPGCAVYETYQKCGFAGCPDDQRISQDVRALLSQHPALEPPNLVDVHTLDHVVYLNGLVDTDLERQMAASVAAGAPGVARVVNSIGVSGGAL
jgi:osmotically-inducible protein OsmY